MLSKLKYILVLSICVIYIQIKSQPIANYISNGSFEEHYPCQGFNPIVVVKNWRSIDSSIFSGVFYNNSCYGNIPWDGVNVQYPRSGNAFVTAGFYCPPPSCSNSSNRGYFRNRLKSKLIKDQVYCIRFYVNVRDESSYGINQVGAYFCNDDIDTITKISIPLTYIIPQVNNPISTLITDTSAWTLVNGTFVSTGNEKHLIIGNFRSDISTNTVLINSNSLPLLYCDLNLDDVSCIPLNLSAYAGPDRSCKIGDSVYVGRERDFAIDPGCTWFKLPNMSVPIATASGIWVKPTVTSTYVVKQVLDCSSLKYDTVVVYPDFLGVSLLDVDKFNFKFYPNPAASKLLFEYIEDLKVEKISFIDLLGRETLIFIDPKKEIDISSLPTGLFYLNVETNKGNKTFKLQKE